MTPRSSTAAGVDVHASNTRRFETAVGPRACELRRDARHTVGTSLFVSERLALRLSARARTSLHLLPSVWTTLSLWTPLRWVCILQTVIPRRPDRTVAYRSALAGNDPGPRGGATPAGPIGIPIPYCRVHAENVQSSYIKIMLQYLLFTRQTHGQTTELGSGAGPTRLGQ